jgi:hypothetical protein
MQMLTPLNSVDLGTEIPFAQLPHAIRGEYFDESDDYVQKDDALIYAEGFDEETATRIEALNYQGFTDKTKLEARITLDMRQLYLRQVRYHRRVSQEGFLCPRGTLVGLTDEVLTQHQRYALITEVLIEGGNIVGFMLDSLVDLSAGRHDPFAVDEPFAGDPNVDNPIGIMIRKNNAQAVTHEVIEKNETNRVTLSTPVAYAGQYEKGQLAVLGVLGKETRRCKVFSVDPGDDDTFDLTLVDEAPEIHA